MNLRLLHPEKQDSDDGDATTLIMMNEELWLSLLVLMSEGDDGDGDDHVGDDDVGDDDVGDENSYDLHDDLLFLSITHSCLLSSSEKNIKNRNSYLCTSSIDANSNINDTFTMAVTHHPHSHPKPKAPVTIKSILTWPLPPPFLSSPTPPT